MEPKADTAPVDDEVASKAGDIPAEEEAVPVVAPAPGQRRRGRRKVMKRRTIKDEEGYLGKPRVFSLSVLCLVSELFGFPPLDHALQLSVGLGLLDHI